MPDIALDALYMLPHLIIPTTTERLINLPKITQLLMGGAVTQPR